jgi:hypothetical protein
MISTYFTTTPSVPEAPPEVKPGSITSLPPVEPWYLKDNLPSRLRNALRPINPDNACTLCITAAAGTELAGAYSRQYLYCRKRSLQPEGLNPPRGIATSDFRPLCTIPCCCHP